MLPLTPIFWPSQPFLPSSESNALCDSDESGAEDDEDDDDAFLSDTQMTEHSDPNSYRWAVLLFYPIIWEAVPLVLTTLCAVYLAP